MTGICGWCGPLSSQEYNAETVIEGMSSRLIRGEHDREMAAHIKRHAEMSLGLAVLPATTENGLANKDSYFAVLHGLCRWEDDALSQLSRRENDAAALIEGYRRYGKDVLKKIKGPFSLALIDAQAQEALIAIDRMAIQTLSYGIGKGGQFVFGTVTDSVKSFPEMTSTLSAQAIYNYLSNYVVPAPTPPTSQPTF